MKNYAIKHLDPRRWLLLAVFAVPLNKASEWQRFEFHKEQPCQVTHSDKGMTLTVKNSATAFIHVLKEPLMAKGIRVKATLKTSPMRIPASIGQGSAKADDFTLRVGLVLKGESKLNFFERLIAPQWLVDMERLLPENMGVKEVDFQTTCQQDHLLGQRRHHALDTALVETCRTLIKNSGPFKIEHVYDKPVKVIGVWIGSDGDQTKSEYALNIQEVLVSYK